MGRKAGKRVAVPNATTPNVAHSLLVSGFTLQTLRDEVTFVNGDESPIHTRGVPSMAVSQARLVGRVSRQPGDPDEPPGQGRTGSGLPLPEAIVQPVDLNATP